MDYANIITVARCQGGHIFYSYIFQCVKYIEECPSPFNYFLKLLRKASIKYFYLPFKSGQNLYEKQKLITILVQSNLIQYLSARKNLKGKNTNIIKKKKVLNPVLQIKRLRIHYHGLAAQQMSMTSTGETEKHKNKFSGIALIQLPNHGYSALSVTYSSPAMERQPVKCAQLQLRYIAATS